MSRLFVGDLPFRTSERDLEEMFSQHGKLTAYEIVRERATRSSRGFGFVTFESEEEAKSAVDALNGTDVGGRKIKVEVAVLRTERPSLPPQPDAHP